MSTAMTTDLDRFELARQRLAAPKPVDLPLVQILAEQHDRANGCVYRDESDDCLECDCAHQMPRDSNDPGAYPGPDPDCDCECH